MSSLPSARLQVLVLTHRGRWFINFRGKRAKFADRASAIREAIDEAYQCSKNGTPTDVLFVDPMASNKMLFGLAVSTPRQPPSYKIAIRGTFAPRRSTQESHRLWSRRAIAERAVPWPLN